MMLAVCAVGGERLVVPWTPHDLRRTVATRIAQQLGVGGEQLIKRVLAVSQMRVLGRWMRMIIIPNQSSVAKAYQEFDESGPMKPSSYLDRVVDVMEELMKFTLLTRDVAGYLVDRYSERKESAEALSRRANQRAI